MNKLSHNTISRVFLYIRILEGLIKKKNLSISSRELAEFAGSSDVQVRKDISNFGKVGTPGIGYNTVELRDTLVNFVLKEHVVSAVLFGVGNLGTAILRYPSFYKERIKIVAAFDRSSSKIGKTINGLEVFSVASAKRVIKEKSVDIAIIAVPEESAQEVADIAVDSELKGIVNFSPITINVPSGVFVKDMDFTIEFLSLYCDAYMVNGQAGKSRKQLISRS
ncbi:MAG: redox-sensing transcriptional repressor Rex [Candidatus Kaelpia aquatica]|nr:redox-sensing transcriptional repressor Rex [Candidatus Kaelpia aquatica]